MAKETKRVMTTSPTTIPENYSVKSDPQSSVASQKPKCRLSCRPIKLVNKGKCSVCISDFLRAENVISLSPKHTFHIECVEGWLRLNERCSDFPPTMLKVLRRMAENVKSTKSSEKSSEFITI